MKKTETQFEPAISEPSPQEKYALMARFNEGRYADALPLAQSITTRFPEYGFAWKVLGAVLMQMALVADALAAMQNAAALSPGDAESHNNLGVILNGLGRIDEAEACYMQALAIDLESCAALRGLGDIYTGKGQIEKAQSFYLRALKVKPDDMEVRYSLAISSKAKEEDTNFMALVVAAEAAHKSENPMSGKNKMFLHFALGKCYDDTGNYEKAFPHFLEACKLKRATFNYNPDSATQLCSAIIEIFDRAKVDRLRGAGGTSSLPIFVLGMPRSGSTLAEQIISSHPDVVGAGELHDLLNIAKRNIEGTANSITLLENLRSLDYSTLTAWGAEYVAGLKRRAPDAKRITDKMPDNFWVLGLIHLMLPNAKIIHVNRDPVDTCLSCFIQHFANAHEHTYDLGELGRYYADYSRLMKHWRSVLPDGAFLDVNYEDIVADKEAQSRRIIEYCGLDWNDACLNPHENERAIRTASMAQVRQPGRLLIIVPT